MAEEEGKKGGVDAELATGLKTAMRRKANKPMAFAVIAKDSSDGVLIISKKKIAPAVISDAKKKTKGKLLARGICHGEDGQLVFTSTKKAPTTLVKTIKSIAKKYARITVKPLVKTVGETSNNDQKEKPEGKEKSKKKEGLDVKFKQVLRALKPKLLKALNRDSGERDLMHNLYNNLSVRADKRDWEGGLDDLKTLEKLIPDALASKVAREIMPLEVEYRRTLARLKPQMLRVIKARKMHPAAVRIRWRSAEQHARKGNFEDALQSLNDLEEIMNRESEPPRQLASKKKAPKLTRMQSAARKLVVKWNVAKANANKQIARVQAAMRKEGPEIAEKAEVYNNALHNYGDDWAGYLKAAAQTDDPKVSKEEYAKALERVEQRKERLAEDPVLKMLDYNEYVPVTIAKDLTQPLSDLAQVLGALANEE